MSVFFDIPSSEVLGSRMAANAVESLFVCIVLR